MPSRRIGITTGQKWEVGYANAPFVSFVRETIVAHRRETQCARAGTAWNFCCVLLPESVVLYGCGPFVKSHRFEMGGCACLLSGNRVHVVSMIFRLWQPTASAVAILPSAHQFVYVEVNRPDIHLSKSRCWHVTRASRYVLLNIKRGILRGYSPVLMLEQWLAR